MTKYREILRLKSLGFSERNIAQSCGVSRNTVAKVLKALSELWVFQEKVDMKVSAFSFNSSLLIFGYL